MTMIETDDTALRWTSFVSEAARIHLHDASAVVEVATRLIVDWGSNKVEMYQLLLHGVNLGALPQQVLSCWDQAMTRGASDSDAAEDLPSVAPSCSSSLASSLAPSLPLQLQPLSRSIGECGRRQGRQALEMGRKLLSAKEICAACGYGFETFLAGLRRDYGINRATCYMNLKFAQWNLPECLGTATMKWIVQGFEKDSVEAREVIKAAAEEKLTLEALAARYGSLRRGGRAAQLLAQAADLRDPDLLIKLCRRKQRLEQERAALDTEIRQLELTLQLLVLPTTATTEIDEVASCDMEPRATLRAELAQSSSEPAFAIVDNSKFCDKAGERPCSPSS